MTATRMMNSRNETATPRFVASHVIAANATTAMATALMTISEVGPLDSPDFARRRALVTSLKTIASTTTPAIVYASHGGRNQVVANCTIQELYGRLMVPVGPSTHSCRPRKPISPARVTTNVGTPKRVNRKPYRNPIAAPTISAKTIDSQMGHCQLMNA